MLSAVVHGIVNVCVFAFTIHLDGSSPMANRCCVHSPFVSSTYQYIYNTNCGGRNLGTSAHLVVAFAVYRVVGEEWVIDNV